MTSRKRECRGLGLVFWSKEANKDLDSEPQLLSCKTEARTEERGELWKVGLTRAGHQACPSLPGAVPSPGSRVCPGCRPQRAPKGGAASCWGHKMLSQLPKARSAFF